MANLGYIAVDLDGTLAHYESGDIQKYGVEHIGQPIPAMVERVQNWLKAGYEVRIFTARIALRDPQQLAVIRTRIIDWCIKHIGVPLEITNVKDFHMIALWDDRCVQVIPNTGEPIGNLSIKDLPQEAQTVNLSDDVDEEYEDYVSPPRCCSEPWEECLHGKGFESFFINGHQVLKEEFETEHAGRHVQ